MAAASINFRPATSTFSDTPHIQLWLCKRVKHPTFITGWDGALPEGPHDKDVIHAYHGCRDRILIYGGALLGLMGKKHYDLHPAGWMTGCTAKSFEREGRT